MASIYPNSIFGWTPRHDFTDIVFANDPNTLATEIQGIETIIGTIPQIEQFPPTGPPVAFQTLSARVTAAINNSQLPYTVLTAPPFFIAQGQQLFNHYKVSRDPFKMYNGQDITIPCDGYWSVHADQKWNQGPNEFRGGNVLFLYLNGDWIDSDQWDWTAAYNNFQFHYASNIYGSQGWTKIKWEGLLHKGDRLQVLSANSTFCPGIEVTGINLKAFCHKTVSGSPFTSG